MANGRPLSTLSGVTSNTRPIMSDIQVSVIIPVYNGQEYLRECLDSVLKQTLKNIEIIIINDASSDRSQDIIDEYAQFDGRIHAIHQRQNKGVCIARNTGIDKATGEFIIFLDADDYWTDVRMLSSLCALAHRDNSAIVNFGYRRMTLNGETVLDIVNKAETIELQKSKNWVIKYNSTAILISRELLVKHHIRFDPSLIMGEDALFCCALYCYASRLTITDEIYYCYRINPESANNANWNSYKLFCTVRWFELAIDVIRHSPVFQHRPDLLQSIIGERLNMLSQKLGGMALEILSQSELREYILIWARCFAYLDHDYFDKHIYPRGWPELNRNMLELIMKNDITAFRRLFSSDTYLRNMPTPIKQVVLSQQEASALANSLLQVVQPQIRCDLGNGVIVTLSRNEAHRLAQQLVNNQQPTISLAFK